MGKEKNHVLDFIIAGYKFADRWGYTSSLDIDENTVVADLTEDICNEPAGIIAEIQNINGEYLPRLIAYYEDTRDKKALRRCKSIIDKYQT